jgi:hypothetical protein
MRDHPFIMKAPVRAKPSLKYRELEKHPYDTSWSGEDPRKVAF